MKAVRYLILTWAVIASLCGSRTAWAQATATPPNSTPPVIVAGSADPSLSTVPPEIKTLVKTFDQTRDKYLATQDLLLFELKHTTTAVQREQIRVQLQENRQAFLASLRGFRQQLKDELTALKGKISHEEFLRIIDAAHNAAAEGGIGHHKGH
ncbi:MAG TPA: hypothetical protein VMR33_09415 [Candidatus Baltobacteraceae bacterium]|jgi:hypothetical protein|nr:hypothetical protein [Candidatus Baltobacteraceae bacterium]